MASADLLDGLAPMLPAEVFFAIGAKISTLRREGRLPESGFTRLLDLNQALSDHLAPRDLAPREPGEAHFAISYDTIQDSSTTKLVTEVQLPLSYMRSSDYAVIQVAMHDDDGTTVEMDLPLQLLVGEWPPEARAVLGFSVVLRRTSGTGAQCVLIGLTTSPWLRPLVEQLHAVRGGRDHGFREAWAEFSNGEPVTLAISLLAAGPSTAHAEAWIRGYLSDASARGAQHLKPLNLSAYEAEGDGRGWCRRLLVPGWWEQELG